MNRMMPPMDEPTGPMPMDMGEDAPDEPSGAMLACKDGTCVHNDDAGSCTLDLILVELDENHNCLAYEPAEGTEAEDEPLPFEPPAPRPAPRRLPSVPTPPRR